MNLEFGSGAVQISALGLRPAGRFLVIVEYTSGAPFSGAVLQSPEDAVEAFMVRTPDREEGEIALFDPEEQRVVASVKRQMGRTEIGLRVLHRRNVFHDWHLALEVQKRRTVQAAVELSG